MKFWNKIKAWCTYEQHSPPMPRSEFKPRQRTTGQGYKPDPKDKPITTGYQPKAGQDGPIVFPPPPKGNRPAVLIIDDRISPKNQEGPDFEGPRKYTNEVLKNAKPQQVFWDGDNLVTGDGTVVNKND